MATSWKMWTAWSVAAVAMTTTSTVHAQQFQEPRLPRGYEPLSSFASDAADSSSRSAGRQVQQPVAPVVVYRVPANQAVGKSSQSYAPPVHISPGSRSSLPNNPYADDRSTRPDVNLNHQFDQERVSQAIDVLPRQDRQAGVQSPNPVRRTSMQESFQDPFGDSRLNEPELNALQLTPPRSGEYESLRNGFESETSVRQIPSRTLPRYSQPLPKPVSILSGSDQSSEDDTEVEVLGDGDFGQDLEEPLNKQIEETENELRRREFDDEPDLFEEMATQRGTRSLLNWDDEGDREEDGRNRSPLDKSCEDFRVKLLDNPIRDIALDMIPPVSGMRDQNAAISRSWTDRSGNVIATGGMKDLSRGYVVLDSGQRIAFHRLSEADRATVSDYWQLPVTCSPGDRGSVSRNWVPQTYTWTATSLCHKPLYFENVQLERYGHSYGPFDQPIKSVGHFFISLVTLPYQSAMHPANECQYALGFYRPGDCAPWLIEPIPISLAGTLRESLLIAGLAAIP